MIKHKRKSAITVYLTSWLSLYKAAEYYVAFDVETDNDIENQKMQDGNIFAYCVTDKHGNTEVWRMDTDDKDHNEAGWERLRRLFADGKTAIIAHNFKAEYTMLHKHKIEIHPRTIWHDTMLMSRMLRNLWPSHALDYAPYILCNYPKKYDEIVKRQVDARGHRFDNVDKQVMHRYQITDGERTMILFLTWIEEFTNNDALYLDYIVEIETVKATYEMEQFGIELDWDQSNALISELENKLDTLQQEVYDYLGEYVNLNSDIVVRRLFYKKFQFPVVQFTKKGHKPAVDKTVIKQLKDLGYDNPILDMVLKTRTWSNALAMIKGYQQRADVNGIIYPTINSCIAKTRRQSGENPNMQNVSKEEKLDNPYAVPARRCFRARKNSFLIFVDYAGIEMRLMIELANSIRMMNIIRSGGNVHEVACKLFYGERFRSKKLDKTLYDCGKNGHFALPYGCSPTKLGMTLKLTDPKREGQEAFERYAAEFPEIAFLARTVSEEVRENSYVLLPFGSKLYVPISKAYAGLNYKIQGTAALILKRAEVMLSKYFREVWDNQIRLILPIHDELVIHFPVVLEQYLDCVLFDIRRLMIDIPEIKVPLDAEFKKTDTIWSAAKGVEFNPPQEWIDNYYSRIFGMDLKLAA